MKKKYTFRWVLSIPFRIIRRFINWILDEPLEKDDIRFRFPEVIFQNTTVTIGKRVFIGPGSYFGGKSTIVIGDDTMIAPHVCVLTNTHDYNKNPMWQTIIFRPVYIGKFVWIGYGAIILSGVKIGDNAIIGAGCVVTKHVPDNAVVVGNPARIIKYRDVPILDKNIQQKYPYYWEDVFEDHLSPEQITREN
jgi:acetyltransferase-like isoleucine patch superfamily enzyme